MVTRNAAVRFARPRCSNHYHPQTPAKCGVSPAISLFPPPLFENSSVHGWVAAQHVYPDEAPCIDRF